MADPSGFLKYSRRPPDRRPVGERVHDHAEVYVPAPIPIVQQQAARCMGCAVPFCHWGCPLGNLIPEWNELVHRDDWHAAIDRLERTNNFPEFTGRLCPAPCEPACVLAINDDPVTIKSIESAIIDRAFEEGWIHPHPPDHRTGKRVAVIGSGPAGLAVAQQLNRAGHDVTVYERDDRLGGLMRYGIPDFKMDKRLLDRRLDLLSAEGIAFETGYDIGSNGEARSFVDEYDATVIAIGAQAARDLVLPGRELRGIHLAMDYLTQRNRIVAGDQISAVETITARDKHVVIIGGGDTGADCLGNAHRESPSSVEQLYLYAAPPNTRSEANPWPEAPIILQTSPAHEEGGNREFGVLATHFEGAGGNVQRVHGVRSEVSSTPSGRRVIPLADQSVVFDSDLVLIAAGFTGPSPEGIISQLGIALDDRGAVAVDPSMQTSVPGIFSAGDAMRGASLIVWAIADGRRAATGCDAYLSAGLSRRAS